MTTTLEAQREKLEQEIQEAYEQLEMLRQQPCPNFKILNYYTDVVARNTQLVEMIDCHIFDRTQSVQ
ncbi:hypothetical protein OLMES_0060 [Oleiphilus messinensis]|uniref:Uncharacterized protein n=1 Tax=Oleiphilus messinensis TaxID=141451 RepID=A0A1Y0I1T0_9GAMM|nr:hypothetical protein [Oleiphilus messinensis]ARU54169.1 hypothetical protein OLMES_0060 [Oleiphilus messinensis]